MMTKKRRRWNISGVVLDVLDDLIGGHPSWNAKEIYEEMVGRIKGLENPPPLPTLRTVQTYVAYSRPADPSGRWVPTDWPGEDTALVFEALGDEMHELTGGGSKDLFKRMTGFVSPWPTVREAERILWVRRAAPSLWPGSARIIARFYLMYEARQESTERLDWVLAYRVWESPSKWKAYHNAVEQGEIPGLYVSPGFFLWTKPGQLWRAISLSQPEAESNGAEQPPETQPNEE